MSPMDPKIQITQALSDFAHGNLTESGLKIFETLGYNTQRRAALASKTPDYFVNTFAQASGRFDVEKALVSEWKYVDQRIILTSVHEG